MAAISGIGKVKDGSLVEYMDTGGIREGVVLDQSDPAIWVHDGNATLLTLTVLPTEREEPVDISGRQVQDVVADPGEHSERTEPTTPPGEGPSGRADAPEEPVRPDGPEDVETFLERLDGRQCVLTHTVDGEPEDVTVDVERVGSALIHVTTDAGDELGIPYATLESLDPEGTDE